MADIPEIPKALKADVPQSQWGKILLSTPIVMSVVATLLAGLASSEMTRAQYDRSLAAQLQSKAADQWGYFQAKKLRAAMQEDTVVLLQASGPIHPLDARSLERYGELDPGALAALQKGELPEVPALKLAPSLQAALDAVQSGQPEADIALRLAAVKNEAVADALKSAKANAEAFDAAIRPINQAVERFDKALAAGNVPGLARDYTAARLRFAAVRYEAEARQNQAIANLLELQIRKAVLSSDRHRWRSERFFYGMLGAQVAVVVSTLSLAAQKRSVLWGLAAAAGLAAIAFAAYVYFSV
jgi:hypothetical protein